MEVFERPAATFVAGFIGSPPMNFLAATLTNDGYAARLAAGPVVRFHDGRRKEPTGAS